MECDPPPGKRATPDQEKKLRQSGGGDGGLPSNLTPPTYGTQFEGELHKIFGGLRKRRSDDCNDKRVVISYHSSHSAKEVCQSRTSSGPDFVSVQERVFCDMCTHTLYPVCGDTKSSGCFDLETQKMRPATGLQGRNKASVPAKSYGSTLEWGKE